MSIQTQDPMNEESKAMLKEMFGDPVAQDAKTMLYNRFDALNSKSMGDVARAAGQVVTAELNDIGDIKEMSDGSKYELKLSGWVKHGR